MAWPLSQDYNEAIQTPAVSFGDPDLRRGEAVTNALGLPQPCSGNFADVYQVRADQRSWAVKCFTREIPGLQERYREISAALRQARLPFMVDFQFLDQGIRVRGRWYPVLKMQWVEGFTFNQFVRDHLDRPAVLDGVAQIWVKLARRLREANLAHGDLQHGNVILVPGSKASSLAVRLVDYDGMCVPALSLLKPVEVGHPNYQHPQRLREAVYSLEVDRFSHLVIYTALRALVAGGRPLWDRHDNGDNLLFKQADLEAPSRSALFEELARLPDPAVNRLAEALAAAAARPLDQAPLLEELTEPPLPVATSGPTPAAGPRRAEDIFAAAVAEPAPAARMLQPRTLTGLVAAGVVGLLALLGGAVVFLVAAGSPKPKREQAVVPQVPRAAVTPALPPEAPGQNVESETPEKAPPPAVPPPAPAPDLTRLPLVRTPTVGGRGGSAVEVVSPDRRPVVGLAVTFGNFAGHRVLKSIQPLFLDRDGTKVGQTVGRPSGRGDAAEARDGYAVGGIVARGGQRVDGLRVIFMRRQGDRLDPNDTYESEWLGGKGGGSEVRLAGDGRPVVGVHGRSGAELDAVGLIQLDLPPP